VRREGFQNVPPSAPPAGGPTQVVEASARACPQCNAPGTQLAFFDDGSFICQNCDYVSGGMAQEEVDRILAEEAGPQAPAPSAVPPGQPQQVAPGVTMMMPPQQFQPAPAPVAAPPPVPVAPRPVAAPETRGYTVAVGPPALSTSEAVNRLDRIESNLGDIATKVNKHEDLYSRLQSDLQEMRDKLPRLEAATLELQGLYDSVSTLFNPFIEVNAQTIREFIDTIKTLDPEVLKRISKGDFAKEGEELDSIFGEGAAAEPAKPAPPPVPTCAHCGQVLPGAAAAAAHVHEGPKVILERIGGELNAAMLSMQWLDFLLAKVGPDKLPILLDYYVKLNWIGTEVKTELILRTRGVSQAVAKEFGDWRLNPADQLKSLLFIYKIRGSELDRETIEKLEKDLQAAKQ
jgi:archaellum component FlaD/FlaE